MRQVISALGIILAVGIVTYLVVGVRTVPLAPIDTYEYVSETYGIAFDYPEGYVLEQGERGTGERRHYAITLIKETDLPPAANGEGPTAITIDIYQNDIENLSLNEWLTGTNQSNFKLGDGTYASTTVDGASAVAYRWSGLYEGETTALIHKDNVVALSVTFLTPEDAIIDVYRDILDSIGLK